MNSKFSLSNLKNTLKKCFIGKLTKVKRCLPHYNYNFCAWVSQISDFPQPAIFIQGVWTLKNNLGCCFRTSEKYDNFPLVPTVSTDSFETPVLSPTVYKLKVLFYLWNQTIGTSEPLYIWTQHNQLQTNNNVTYRRL